MTNISVLGLRLVKESSGRYDIQKKINKPSVAHEIFCKVLELDTRSEEVVAMITVDTKNNVNGVFIISQGSINSSIVHPREVFKRALMNNAASIIVAHNHPTGVCNPSKEDINVTHRLKRAGEIVGIELLDHLIIGDNNYISLKDEKIF